MYYSKINNSYSLAEVTSSIADCRVGGLVGVFQGGSITNCFTESTVKGINYVGGLMGTVWHGSIINSYTSSNVEGINFVGGIAGDAKLESIENCYSDSIVKGDSYIGGIVGVLNPVDSDFVLKNSCFVGTVEGLSIVGGIVGSIGTKGYVGDIENIYVKANVNCLNKRAGGVIGNIDNPNSTLNIKNIKSYSKVIDVNNKKDEIANFIGRCNLSSDGINFGTMNIENCSVLSSQEKMISPLTGDSISYDINNLLTGIKEVELPRQDVFLQVGTSSDENSSIIFNSKVEYDIIKGLKNFDITSEETFSFLDNFLSDLNDKQTQLGAVQNRLDSALDEITTQYDNLVSSRSTLRDADMAELSSTYIQQQILQQASTTLMASSRNLRYENVLGLLNGLR